MIKEVKMYTVACDRCGVEAFADHEITAWGERDCVWELAQENYWRKINGKHYCPDCFEVGDNYEVVVKSDMIPDKTFRMGSAKLEISITQANDLKYIKMTAYQDERIFKSVSFRLAEIEHATVVQIKENLIANVIPSFFAHYIFEYMNCGLTSESTNIDLN